MPAAARPTPIGIQAQTAAVLRSRVLRAAPRVTMLPEEMRRQQQAWTCLLYTSYPLLKMRRAEGYFEVYLRESTSGPARKYYRLTQKGYYTQRLLENE